MIIGRGGVAITRDMTNALHIRLVAPLYWRVENVMKKKGMIIQKAEEYVIETDEKRNKMIAGFLDKKPQTIDYLFDSYPEQKQFFD